MREGGRMTQIGDVRLNVVDRGAGVPILLLHGFPDSCALWRDVIPALVAGGCRAIAPDLRGFGDSDAPPRVAAYALDAILGDVIALLDALNVARVHVVGHDWGAVVGWFLAARHPGQVASFVAVSVGHPAAFRRAGMEQKLRSWYVLAFQVRAFPELALRAGNFALLRAMTSRHPENERWIADLSRPGRLSAGLAWYRANFGRLLSASVPPVRVPVLGVWSPRDLALAEDQMTGSQRFVEAVFRYERIEGVSHWIPLDAPERLASLVLDWVAPHARTRPARSSSADPANAAPRGLGSAIAQRSSSRRVAPEQTLRHHRPRRPGGPEAS
jgi:pimeloyl-ACP methyl ester carboxylesterase